MGSVSVKLKLYQPMRHVDGCPRLRYRRATITLYDNAFSPFARKVRIVLEHKGLPIARSPKLSHGKEQR